MNDVFMYLPKTPDHTRTFNNPHEERHRRIRIRVEAVDGVTEPERRSAGIKDMGYDIELQRRGTGEAMQVHMPYSESIERIEHGKAERIFDLDAGDVYDGIDVEIKDKPAGKRAKVLGTAFLTTEALFRNHQDEVFGFEVEDAGKVYLSWTEAA